MIKSNAYNHKNEILELFQSGRLVTVIARKYKCNLQIIRKIILEKYSYEEYRKIVKRKTGAGAPKRKRRTKHDFDSHSNDSIGRNSGTEQS